MIIIETKVKDVPIRATSASMSECILALYSYAEWLKYVDWDIKRDDEIQEQLHTPASTPVKDGERVRLSAEELTEILLNLKAYEHKDKE